MILKLILQHSSRTLMLHRSASSHPVKRSTCMSANARRMPVAVRSLYQQQHGAPSPNWLPPAQWVSGVLGHLHHSVDVDSVDAYTQLLQECLVLQPSLLNIPPAEAAATCWTLECYTRSSAVWFGPDMISKTLQTQTPTSLQQHLTALMDLWTSHGQRPHTFGQIWLYAPSALLQRNVTEFESYLQQLQQLVPELPPCELLASGASLAGFLLSLGDVGELEGHVHREVPGVILISHPHLHEVHVQQQAITQQQQQQQQHQGQQQQVQQQGRHELQLVAVSVFGAVRRPTDINQSQQQQQQGALPTPSSSTSSNQLPPWQQQPERKHTGGVYQQPSPPYPGDQQQQQDTCSSSSSSSSEGVGVPQLLAEFEVWVSAAGGTPQPLLVVPPQR